MAIEVLSHSRVDCPNEELRALLTFCISELGLNPECELNLLLVDEPEMADLHMKWMDEPGPTDVLSFPMDEVGPNWKEIAILGDIVVCPAIAHAQALSASHSFEHEMSILSVHGLLHILGYDHAGPAEEKEMFALQESLIARWGQ
jgi:probable rRNA maturation factor